MNDVPSGRSFFVGLWVFDQVRGGMSDDCGEAQRGGAPIGPDGICR